MNSNQTSPKQLEALRRNAIDAFWKVVVDVFPEATSGDLSPLATLALDTAADEALREWITNNVPVLCKTCGSRIGELTNPSTFGGGECETCEGRRYTSQPALLDACYQSLGFVESWERTNGTKEPTVTRKTLLAAIHQANGHAA